MIRLLPAFFNRRRDLAKRGPPCEAGTPGTQSYSGASSGGIGSARAASLIVTPATTKK